MMKMLLFFVLQCMALTTFAEPSMQASRQAEAEYWVQTWTSDKLLTVPVTINIQIGNPHNTALSSRHETEFKGKSCIITMYIDPVNGGPGLPGMTALYDHEYQMAFEMVLFHELTHCVHIVQPLRFEHPGWSAELNNTMNVQMVMAKQMFNESRFIDAQMEHVADAFASIRLRQYYHNSIHVNEFIQKYIGLRNHWSNYAKSVQGENVHIQHATQLALNWGLARKLDDALTPSEMFHNAVQEGSRTAMMQMQKEYAWGGLGALICAYPSSPESWAATAASAVSRVNAHDTMFSLPGPWRALPLQISTPLDADALFYNEKVFKSKYAQEFLTRLDTLTKFVTRDKQIPLDPDKIGVPEGMVPMSLEDTSIIPITFPVRKLNGCVAVNPLD